MIWKYERELKKSNISDWARVLLRNKLNYYNKLRRELIHKAWKDEEYERYCEIEAERDREDKKLNIFDQRIYDKQEEELNEVWLEAYDYYNDL